MVRKVFVISFLTTLSLFFLLWIVGWPLSASDLSPYGIISFEFVGSIDAAKNMINSWGPTGRSAAIWSLALDFPFLISYSITLMTAWILVLERRFAYRDTWPIYGQLSVWAMLLPGLLDCVENVALLRILYGTTEEVWPRLAYWCAAVKFFLLGLAVLFLFLLWARPGSPKVARQ